jgi:hypothetical protein
VKPADGVVFQEVEGEMVLLSLESERYYALDDVGSRFWELLIEHGDLERVVAVMLDEFAVDEPTLRADLDALVAQLREAGLVVPSERTV